MNAQVRTDGRFIIGDFSIGGPGIISDIGEDTPAALRHNGLYAYKLLWSYIDENGNNIIGAPSESLYVTRKESQRPVDIDLVITIPDEILTSPNINNYTFEIFRSSKSANSGFLSDITIRLNGFLVVSSYSTTPVKINPSSCLGTVEALADLDDLKISNV